MFSSVRACHWNGVEDTDCHWRQERDENKLSLCLNKYDIHCQTMDTLVQSLWYLLLEKVMREKKNGLCRSHGCMVKILAFINNFFVFAHPMQKETKETIFFYTLLIWLGKYTFCHIDLDVYIFHSTWNQRDHLIWCLVSFWIEILLYLFHVMPQ